MRVVIYKDIEHGIVHKNVDSVKMQPSKMVVVVGDERFEYSKPLHCRVVWDE